MCAQLVLSSVNFVDLRYIHLVQPIYAKMQFKAEIWHLRYIIIFGIVVLGNILVLVPLVLVGSCMIMSTSTKLAKDAYR